MEKNLKKTSEVAMVAPKIHEKPMIYQLYHHNPHDMSIFYVFFSFVWFNQLNPLAFLESWPFSLMLEVDTPRRERDHYRIDHQKNVEDGFFQGDDISYTSCIYIYISYISSYHHETNRVVNLLDHVFTAPKDQVCIPSESPSNFYPSRWWSLYPQWQHRQPRKAMENPL